MAKVKTPAAGWYNRLVWDLYKQHKEKLPDNIYSELANLGIKLVHENGKYYVILDDKDLVWLQLKYE